MPPLPRNEMQEETIGLKSHGTQTCSAKHDVLASKGLSSIAKCQKES